MEAQRRASRWVRGEGGGRTAAVERHQALPACKWILCRELSVQVDVDVSREMEVRTRVRKKEIARAK